MIRPYTTEDFNAVMELLALNTPAYFHRNEKPDLEQYLANEIEDYYVFELDTRVVASGGINYFVDEKLARISWDIVHPDHQGKGVGQQLLLYRIDRIKSRSDLDTVVVRTSQLAKGFYAKNGFDLVKTVADFWAPGLDLYQMQMQLHNG